MKPVDYLMSVKVIQKFHEDLYRFFSKVEINKSTECWEWTNAMASGYGKFKFNGAFDGAHRVSYQLFIGPIEDGMFICHRCDNPKCVNPGHLFPGTHSDNMKDAYAKGRLNLSEVNSYQKGHVPHNRCLSPEVVKLIKIEIEHNQLSMPKIAEKYGVKYQTIRDIKAKRAYLE